MARKLYLVRNKGEETAYLLRRKPKMVTIPAKEAQSCYCGDERCGYSQEAEPARKVFDTDGCVYNFCTDGLAEAGIKIKEGQVLVVTVESVK